jgi:undecaprenyl-diphosphatase
MMLLTRLDERDRALFLRWAMLENASASARIFWRTVTHLGSAPAAIAACLLPMALGGAVASASTRALLSLVVSHIVVQLVKRTVGRPRPLRDRVWRSLVAAPDRFSFPSGHSAAAMSVALIYCVRFPELGVVLMPLAMLVGISRVCLGVHYPGDVLMGQLLALLTGVIVLR